MKGVHFCRIVRFPCQDVGGFPGLSLRDLKRKKVVWRVVVPPIREGPLSLISRYERPLSEMKPFFSFALLLIAPNSFQPDPLPSDPSHSPQRFLTKRPYKLTSLS